MTKPIQRINLRGNQVGKMKDTIPDPFDFAYQQGYAQGRLDAAEAVQNYILSARPGGLLHKITDAAKGQ